jgi:type II secretory pathway component PulJ
LALLSILVALALVAAVVALARLWRAARRLEQVTESYWELRYEYGQLRARVERLEGKPDADAVPPAAFVPLSSIKGQR